MSRYNIDNVELAGYACEGARLLVELEKTDSTIRFEEFGRQVGLIGAEEPWKYSLHIQQISLVLDAIDAMDVLSHSDRSAFHRVVDSGGRPGKRANDTLEIIHHRAPDTSD